MERRGGRDVGHRATRGRRDKLIGLQDELDAARALPDWHGAAGEGARRSPADTRNHAEILVAEVPAVVRALENAWDDVSTLRSRVVNNDSLADIYQFRIADVAQVLRESAQHPSDSYLFGDRGWMTASDVRRDNQKTFLTICTPDPG